MLTIQPLSAGIFDVDVRCILSIPTKFLRFFIILDYNMPFFQKIHSNDSPMPRITKYEDVSAL